MNLQENHCCYAEQGKQVKLTLLRNLVSNEFDNVITLNFERNPEYIAIFDTYDTNDILEKNYFIYRDDLLALEKP